MNVGVLRVAALATAGALMQDAVVAGEGQVEVGLLVFPNVAACRALAPDLVEIEALLVDPRVRAAMRAALERYNAEHAVSSRRVGRALLLREPPALDAGEITDKGYINQRAVLTRRAVEVTRLYAEPADAAVIVV